MISIGAAVSGAHSLPGLKAKASLNVPANWQQTVRRASTLRDVNRLAALLIIAVAVLAGCSDKTQGVPQGAEGSKAADPADPNVAAPQSEIAIGKRKQVTEQLDCTTLVTPSLVSEAIGYQAAAGGRSCEFQVPQTGGGAPGLAQLGFSSAGSGEKSDLDGNSLFRIPPGTDKECDMKLAVARGKFLSVKVTLFQEDRGDVCEKTKSLVKAVFDKLPDA
jgi:hypothetical protein